MTSIKIPKEIWDVIVDLYDKSELSCTKPCEWIIVNGDAYNLNHVYKVQMIDGKLQLHLVSANRYDYLTLEESDPVYEKVVTVLGLKACIPHLKNFCTHE
jgi:hypothetical protein